MQSFSQYFGLNKNQYELDFVDVPVNNGDIPLFIDPYTISKRTDLWSLYCHNLIVKFFQDVVDHIRSGNSLIAKYILSGLKEPNQTRFGLSKGCKPRGRGVGPEQTDDLYQALLESSAVKTGFIKDLEDCELLIEGISRDKISDIATNIIKTRLIDYTQSQCLLLNISTYSVSSGFVWDETNKKWIQKYVQLPICHKRSVMLVPKAIARYDMEFDYQEYYQHFVLNFLQSEYLTANSSLVRVLKDGTKKEPTKKSLKSLHPLSKSYLYKFSKNHPEVLQRYKSSKVYSLSEITNEVINNFYPDSKPFDFNNLIQKLSVITLGDSGASNYHQHMIGVLETIFYPSLINPVKEQEIHEGRKRIDIAFENAAKEGFFSALSQIKQIPSGYVFVECKNYSQDPANPELDQLIGRFSVNRGKFGFLVCRKFNNKNLFIKRCKDTAHDGNGYIITLDDEDMRILLEFKKNNDLVNINKFLDKRFRELVF